MFKKNNLTDFEKLLFAESHIKELKKEIAVINIKNGILQSDIDELIDEKAKDKKEFKRILKQENPEANKLEEYKHEIRNLRLKSKMWERKYNDVTSELVMMKNNSKPCQKS
jgi:chromosome segregation ATPase